MRIAKIILSTWVAIGVVVVGGSVFVEDEPVVYQRQAIDQTGLPTLGSGSTTNAVSVTTTNTASEPAATSSSAQTSTGQAPSGSASASNSTTSATATTSTSSRATTAPTSTPAPHEQNTTADNDEQSSNQLPLQPHITPALSVGGVILILTGVVYTLIGVKNRWIHIFISTAYLTSLSICVLILYVMNPPVSNAIQGAYLVGVFMTGIIFGAGALIFKEITEGLGCLLGGFCLAMWFLTLKSGGLITNTTGKAIFITIFCVLAWALSFSHYTRPYSLLGSISFSGATAFVLGIDCFSKGGLKEFWVYVWDLNPDLFPLDTTTYPITKGTRVETIVIVLVCIIGIISQSKLWKVISDRQRKKQDESLEEKRRQEVVEAALGRHLERRNDRDKSEWERQYGNTLHAKRETILWSEAHGEKKSRYSRISETEMVGSPHSSSSESLEMNSLPRQPRSVYVARGKRQSTMHVDAILEVEEPDHSELTAGSKEAQQKKSLARLEGNQSTDMLVSANRTGVSPVPSPQPSPAPETIAKLPSQIQDVRSLTPLPGSSDKLQTESSEQRKSGHLTVEDSDAKKRKSWTSMFSKSSKNDIANTEVNASQEALIVPSLHHSRASSLAATLDSENERIGFNLDAAFSQIERPPEVVTPSPLAKAAMGRPTIHAKSLQADEPPAPPELEEVSDVDPEELLRPAAAAGDTGGSGHSLSASVPVSTRRQSGVLSENDTDGVCNPSSTSHAATSETSVSEVLTKGALDSVPNHLSHVVMSYRTNEWAKHIASADAPVYEEPEVALEGTTESPAHLVHPGEAEKHNVVTEPPPLSPPISAQLATSPVEATVPSPTEGIKVNPSLQPTHLSASIPSISAAASSTLSVHRTRSQTDSNQHRGLRSSSTPMLNQTLITTPIDEHSTVNFTSAQPSVRAPSVQMFNRLSGGGASTTFDNRSPSVLSQYPLGNPQFNQSTSRLSQVYGSSAGMNDMPMRSASQLSLRSVGGLPNNRSDTRLASYNSHQPPRRNTDVEQQRREAMFAEWRVSQQTSPTLQEQAELHRTQMVMQKQQAKQHEELQRSEKARLELAMDMRMRGRDMQELHREAMRRMQAGVNKNVKH